MTERMSSKDRACMDVLSKSTNSPSGYWLGGRRIIDSAHPPISVLVSYWMGGAYLMAIKRYAEFRMIDDHAQAARYRRSCANYDEKKLLISAVFYAINSAFFLGIFLVKYWFEFVVSFPFFALLFSWYLGISMHVRALAISPERLHQERKFAAYVCILVGMLTALLFIDIPFLKYFVDYNQIIRHR